ncbi:DUF397 domain-containing protein [Streptomyces niveus]|uniref:DUF397 domain-containing protein n=1 Tax=Streptomyces niveus TaxID=193462 RepID=UPI003682C53D
MALRKNALDLAPWLKSSYSNAGNNCIEVADLTEQSGIVGIRDSKDEGGPALLMGAAAFTTFIEDVADGRYDA